MTCYIAQNRDINGLFPLVKAWIAECNAETFGLQAKASRVVDDMAELVRNDGSDLVALASRGNWAGFMGLRYFTSPLGGEKIAEEHYWYVGKEYRGRGGLVLLKVARARAKQVGCSHVIITASAMASDMHDKVCALCEHVGMKKFETSFIQEV